MKTKSNQISETGKGENNFSINIKKVTDISLYTSPSSDQTPLT